MKTFGQDHQEKGDFTHRLQVDQEGKYRIQVVDKAVAFGKPYDMEHISAEELL